MKKRRKLTPPTWPTDGNMPGADTDFDSMCLVGELWKIRQEYERRRAYYEHKRDEIDRQFEGRTMLIVGDEHRLANIPPTDPDPEDQ